MKPAARSRPEDVQGLEYDWLATDANGCVALFSTAGGGYAPAPFLEGTQAHDQAIATVLAGPPVTVAAFAPAIPPSLENTWQRAAERGLFAYDADPNGGPYRLVAAPQAPVRVEDLPAAVAAVARGNTLAGVSFAAARRLTREDLERA